MPMSVGNRLMQRQYDDVYKPATVLTDCLTAV